MGQDFGAPYIDSQCFGGQLYDLDNCDEPGTLNEPGEYLPCPQCNHGEWLAERLVQIAEDGFCAREEGKPRQHPFVKERLRFPDDFDEMVATWEDGYDSIDVGQTSLDE